MVGMNKTAVIGIVILIALGAIWYVVSHDSQTESDMNVQNEEQNRNDMGEEGAGDVAGRNDGTSNTSGKIVPVNKVVLAPTETGNFVTVETVTLTKPGFVVLYRVNSNSETDVIGSTGLLNAGTQNNIEVQLDTVIARGQTIVAVLHEDDGDGKFEDTATDGYLGNENMPVVSDVDVVDIKTEDEDTKLQASVEQYLEKNAETDGAPEVN